MVPRGFLKNNRSSRAALPSHPFCAASDLRPELCGWLVPFCTICTSAPANGRDSKGLQTIVSRLCSLIAPLWQRLLLGQSAMCREDCADSEAKLQETWFSDMTVSLNCYLSQELFCGRARSSGLSKFVKLISSRKDEGWKDEGRKDERAKGRSRVEWVERT